MEGLDNRTGVLRENNLIKSNDEFVDYNFACNQNLVEWEDFMLVDGQNLLFYAYDEAPNIDMSQIVSWQVLDGRQKIDSYDVVIHDGLCQSRNSLNGQWHSPNGLPQYGVWWPQDERLVMRNVRQKQYPSNGDHARILSTHAKTPGNFLLKTKFEVGRLGDPDNGYLRLAWDFEDEWDPGHDQTIIYISGEYDYFGVQRVYPIERFFEQGYEPDNKEQDSKMKYSLKANTIYEIHAQVTGQKVIGELHEVRGENTKRVARFDYTFQTPRPETGYPFSFEVTGDIEVTLDEFEVWEV